MTALLALAALTAFDLTCMTTTMTGASGLPEPTKFDGGPVFKVDLDAKRYCQGNCRETMAIERITPTMIYLKATNEPNFEEVFRVSRESGDYLSINRVGHAPAFVTTGHCTAKSFTGFPKRQF